MNKQKDSSIKTIIRRRQRKGFHLYCGYKDDDGGEELGGRERGC